MLGGRRSPRLHPEKTARLVLIMEPKNDVLVLKEWSVRLRESGQVRIVDHRDLVLYAERSVFTETSSKFCFLRSSKDSKMPSWKTNRG